VIKYGRSRETTDDNMKLSKEDSIYLQDN